MLSSSRRKKILSLLETRQEVSTDDLAGLFKVSRETIRRDLMDLEAEGSIRRIHGGAVLAKETSEEPFNDRITLHQREKKAIAKAAAKLIQPGQSILIDAGTTTLAFAQEIADIPDITVITNSFEIVATFHRVGSKVNALLLGGRVVSDVPGTYGELTLSEIVRFKTDVVVVSPVALHCEYGAANYDLYEAEVARTMLTRASRIIMLADHSKLGGSSRVQYCNCSDVDILVTGKKAATSQIKALEMAGIDQVIISKPT